MAIDSPPICINSAAPSTTSKAAAVITSRALAAARMRNSGFSSQIPAAISPANAADADADADPARTVRMVRHHRRHEGDDRQQRHDQQVFEQQDGNDLLPTRQRDVAAFAQQLHDDGGGSQDEAGRADEGHRRAEAVGQPHAGQRDCRTRRSAACPGQRSAGAGSTGARAAFPGRSRTGTSPRPVRRHAGSIAGRRTSRTRTDRSPGQRRDNPAPSPGPGAGRSARRPRPHPAGRRP